MAELRRGGFDEGSASRSRCACKYSLVNACSSLNSRGRSSSSPGRGQSFDPMRGLVFSRPILLRVRNSPMSSCTCLASSLRTRLPSEKMCRKLDSGMGSNSWSTRNPICAGYGVGLCLLLAHACSLMFSWPCPAASYTPRK